MCEGVVNILGECKYNHGHRFLYHFPPFQTHSIDIFALNSVQVVKGIDAISREQLVNLTTILGIERFIPVFGTVPFLGSFRPAALLPTVTEEDRIVLNNVRRIVEFLTAGSSFSNSVNQVSKQMYHQEIIIQNFLHALN